MPSELKSLKLVDYSDRELLIIVHETAEDGWASSLDISKALGLPQKNGHGTKCVGSRLAALRRFGAVERDLQAPEPARWALSALGQLMAYGKLSNGRLKSYEGTKPEEILLATRTLAELQRNSPEAVKHLTRREWQRVTTMLNGRG